MANAIVLPHVLEYSGAVADKLARLAVALDLGPEELGEAKLSEKSIDKIKQLYEAFNIPDKVA